LCLSVWKTRKSPGRGGTDFGSYRVL